MIGHGGTTAPFADCYREGDTIGVKVHYTPVVKQYIEIFKNGKPVGMIYLINICEEDGD